MISQLQIKDLFFADVASAEAAGRPNEVCFVVATNTWYRYIASGAAYTVDDLSILSTVNGGNTRWLGFAGTYSLTYVVGSNQSALVSGIPNNKFVFYGLDTGADIVPVFRYDDNGTEADKFLASAQDAINVSSRESFLYGNGTNQYWYVPDNDNIDNALNDFAFVKKVRLTDYTPSAAITIARKTDSNTGWILTLETDGKLQLALGNGSNFTTYVYKVATAVRATDNKIAVLGFRIDRDGLVYFYDQVGLIGTVDCSGSSAQSLANAGNLIFWQNVDAATEYAFSDYYTLMFNMLPTDSEMSEFMRGIVPNRYIRANQTALVASWANSGTEPYETFTTAGVDISSAIETGSAGVGGGSYSNVFGKTYRATFTVTLNSGQAPTFYYGATAISVAGTNNAQGVQTVVSGSNTITWTTTSASGTKYICFRNSTAADFAISNYSMVQIGEVADYHQPGNYSIVDNSGNGNHGINSAATLTNAKIGDRMIAYLNTTSTSPTMTDVQLGGWKVNSTSMETAQNLTEIDVTQETSAIELISDKVLNNGKMVWSMLADHNLYAAGTDKDLVFKLTGNGGAGTKIYVELEKVF